MNGYQGQSKPEATAADKTKLYFDRILQAEAFRHENIMKEIEALAAAGIKNFARGDSEKRIVEKNGNGKVKK